MATKRLPDRPADRFRFGADLFGKYQGPGAYQLDADPPGGRASVAKDNVVYIFVRAKDPADDVVETIDDAAVYQTYNHIPQPCALTIGDAFATGTLDCPAVTNDQGDTIGLHVQWGPPPDKPTP